MYEELVKSLRTHGFLYDSKLAVSAADAIEELQKDLDRSKEYEAFWEKEANEALKKFQVAVASKPRWAPVTERLPYPGDKVIVAIRDESGDTRFDFTNTGWWSGYGDKFVVEDEFCSWVTHWMPLPTPPKEETE